MLLHISCLADKTQHHGIIKTHNNKEKQCSCRYLLAQCLFRTTFSYKREAFTFTQTSFECKKRNVILKIRSILLYHTVYLK